MKGLVEYKKNVLGYLFRNYSAEWIFFIFLTFCVALSHLLSFHMSLSDYESVFTPVLNSCMCAFCFIAAWYTWCHHMGMRSRKVWAWILLLIGVGEVAYLVLTFGFEMPFIDITAESVTWHELVISSFLIWVLLLYPAETLTPGWMNLKHALLQLLPVFFWEVLNAILPYNISILLPLYMIVLIIATASHLHPYKLWCEDNFSTMDDIDVRWLIRYVSVVFLLTCSYVYICLSDNPMRSFTQQWMVFFLLMYSTAHILRRRDPWNVLSEEEVDRLDEPHFASMDSGADMTEAEKKTCKERLEHWMDAEKPYLNPDFCLTDMRIVLPLNRTFLTGFIHSEYGCSFYRFVNDYRLGEARRLLGKHPDLPEADIARRSGFTLLEWEKNFSGSL